MNSTHSELISNIKRLTYALKSVESLHRQARESKLKEESEYSPFGKVLLGEFHQGDPTAIHGYADHTEEEHGSEHPKTKIARAASDWIREQPHPTADHIDTVTTFMSDPEHHGHPEITHASKQEQTAYETGAADYGDHAMALREALDKHHHPLSQHDLTNRLYSRDLSNFILRKDKLQNGDYVGVGAGTSSPTYGFVHEIADDGTISVYSGGRTTEHSPQSVRHIAHHHLMEAGL